MSKENPHTTKTDNAAKKRTDPKLLSRKTQEDRSDFSRKKIQKLQNELSRKLRDPDRVYEDYLQAIRNNVYEFVPFLLEQDRGSRKDREFRVKSIADALVLYLYASSGKIPNTVGRLPVEPLSDGAAGFSSDFSSSGESPLAFYNKIAEAPQDFSAQVAAVEYIEAMQGVLREMPAIERGVAADTRVASGAGGPLDPSVRAVDDVEVELSTTPPARDEELGIAPFSFLNEAGERLPYYLLAIPLILSPSNPAAKLLAIAGVAMAMPTTEAAGIAEPQPLETSIFCGPDTSCKLLKEQGHHTRSVEDSELPEVSKATRVIVLSHGRDGKIADHRNVYVEQTDFVNTFFPEAKVVHILACQAGLGKEKYSKKLKDGQVVFVHAGSFDIPIHTTDQIALNLASANPTIFQFSNPVTILHKEGTVTKALRIEPFAISDEIKNIIAPEIGLMGRLFGRAAPTKAEIINGLYDNIAKYIDGQIAKFSTSSSAEIIAAELSKLGYKKLDPEATEEQKQNLVLQVLTENALRENRPDIFRDLLKTFSASELNLETSSGSTVLLVAISNKNNEISMMLAEGLTAEELNEQGASGETALYMAVQTENSRMIDLLIKKIPAQDLNIRKKDGKTPSYKAAASGDLRTLTLMAKKFRREGVDLKILNQADNAGVDAVYEAAQNGRLEILDFFEKNLPAEELYKLRNDGSTAIFIATSKGKSEEVKFLAQYLPEEELNRSMNDGATPALIAANIGRFDILLELVKARANPNQDSRHGTAIDLATAKGCPKKTLEKIEKARQKYLETKEPVIPLVAADREELRKEKPPTKTKAKTHKKAKEPEAEAEL